MGIALVNQRDHFIQREYVTFLRYHRPPTPYSSSVVYVVIPVIFFFAVNARNKKNRHVL